MNPLSPTRDQHQIYSNNINTSLKELKVIRIINYVNYNVRSWFAICDGWILIRFFVFQGLLLLNVKVWSRVFEKRSKFYLYSSKFFIFLCTETWQVSSVPMELPNPSETQIWEGENESVHRH